MDAEELEMNFEEVMEKFRLLLEKTSGRHIEMSELEEFREQLIEKFMLFHSL